MTEERSATATREILLAAARAELLEHGHGGIGLRAVARRAGLSHAAPKYFFQDRAGMLTAVATQGYRELGEALLEVTASGRGNRLESLGRAYIDFGLANPALFDLMFRPAELRMDDDGLQQAQRDSIQPLIAAAGSAESDRIPGVTNGMALVSWALVHGLVVLVRDGALQSATKVAGPEGAAELARTLAALFSERIAARRTSGGTDLTGPDHSPTGPGGRGNGRASARAAERRPSRRSSSPRP